MVIKVSKEVDIAFKELISIAVTKNPLEPFKWIKVANDSTRNWKDDLECINELSTEQLMLMYTIGYDVVEDLINTEDIVYVIIDSKNKFIEFVYTNEPNQYCIYGVNCIYDANVNGNYWEAIGLLNYINDGLNNYTVCKYNVYLPLRVVKVDLKIKVNEVDEEDC